MKNTVAIDQYIEKLNAFPETRWKFYKRSKSNSIYVRDGLDPTRNTRIALKKYRNDVEADCQKIFLRIIDLGQQDWSLNEEESTPKAGKWGELNKKVKAFLTARNKFSTNKNFFGNLNSLEKHNVPFRWAKIKLWVYEKKPDQKTFCHRIDTLSQLQKYFLQESGECPYWLPDEELKAIRRIHNEAIRAKNKGLQKTENTKIRAVVEMQEAEKYFDRYIDDYDWQCWALAMLCCYGLRPHELWYIKEDRKNFLFVPGRLTKSKEDRVTFPIYMHWIEKYKLLENLKKYQSMLREFSPPVITDMNNKSITISVTDPALYESTGRWEGQKNSDLGNWFNKNTIGWWKKGIRKMPEFRGYVPGKNGQKTSSMMTAQPYDLRHSWAIFLATSNQINIPIESRAKAMGHDRVTHEKKYQRWIDQRKLIDKDIDSIVIPDLRAD